MPLLSSERGRRGRWRRCGRRERGGTDLLQLQPIDPERCITFLVTGIIKCKQYFTKKELELKAKLYTSINNMHCVIEELGKALFSNDYSTAQ